MKTKEEKREKEEKSKNKRRKKGKKSKRKPVTSLLWQISLIAFGQYRCSNGIVTSSSGIGRYHSDKAPQKLKIYLKSSTGIFFCFMNWWRIRYVEINSHFVFLVISSDRKGTVSVKISKEMIKNVEQKGIKK